jgi:branched-chain amino acid transport system permease protein
MEIRVFAAFFVVIAAMPLFVGNSVLVVLTSGLVFLLLCYAWNLVGGFLGEMSLAHMVFWAIGGYGTIKFLQAGLPAAVAWPLFAVVAAVAGALLAWTITVSRFTGLFGIAIYTIILAEMAISLAQNLGWLGRDIGLILPALPPGSTRLLYYVILGLALLAVGVNLAVWRGPVGLRWRATKDDVAAAAVVGIHVARERTAAYALSAALCALGGAFQAYYAGYARADVSLSLELLIQAVLAVYVGGAGTALGPLVGAFIIYGLGAVAQTLSSDVNISLYAQLVQYAAALLLISVALRRSGRQDLLTAAFSRGRKVDVDADHRDVSDAEAVAAADRILTGSTGPDSARAGLRVDHVAKSFGAVEVLTDVSFAVRPGEIVAVVGPNGAGKSTLCNIVSGLEPVSAGDVRLDDESLIGVPVRGRAARGIGRTFQTPRLFVSLTLTENLVAGGSFTRADARRALQAVGIDDVDRRYGDDSDFFARRLGEVARAMRQGSTLLLLDEPLAGLTDGEQDVVLDLARAAAARGSAVLLIEHLIPKIAPVADRMVVLADGRVIADGRPGEVLALESVMDSYLGRPVDVTG